VIVRRALAAALLITLLGCGGGESRERTAKDIATLDPGLLGRRVLDLDVAVEDVGDELARETDVYVDALTLFSLRREELLMATMQIARLDDRARVEDPSFRRSFVNSLGGTEPQLVRLGDQELWTTTGNDQELAVWFDDDFLFVLSTRKDYERPRQLLRTMLEVTP
jgi:hypothetical protein